MTLLLRSFSTWAFLQHFRNLGARLRAEPRRIHKFDFVSAVCEANRRSEVHLSQERRLARISISIVWLFMFCHAWRAVPTLYEALHSADGLSVGVSL